MHKTIAVALALGLAAASRRWRRRRPLRSGPQNSAINTSDSKNRIAATGPVKGSNSFTEGEARSRIEDKGFSNVSALKKDDDGIWRGRAMKGGQQVDVALDYQGNVFLRRRGARDERTDHADPEPAHDFRAPAAADRLRASADNSNTQGSDTMITISRLYDDYATAARAVDELERAGIPRDDISIVASNAEGWYDRDRTSSRVDPAHDRDHDGRDDRAEGAAAGRRHRRDARRRGRPARRSWADWPFPASARWLRRAGSLRRRRWPRQAAPPAG